MTVWTKNIIYVTLLAQIIVLVYKQAAELVRGLVAGVVTTETEGHIAERWYSMPVRGLADILSGNPLHFYDVHMMAKAC